MPRRVNPCPCCRGDELPHALIIPVGILPQDGDRPALVLHKCACGHLRGISRADASADLWRRAGYAEEQRRRQMA